MCRAEVIPRRVPRRDEPIFPAFHLHTWVSIAARYAEAIADPMQDSLNMIATVLPEFTWLLPVRRTYMGPITESIINVLEAIRSVVVRVEATPPEVQRNRRGDDSLEAVLEAVQWSFEESIRLAGRGVLRQARFMLRRLEDGQR